MQDNNRVYSYNEAFEASLDYFKGDELAASVFLSKYALRDENGGLFEKTPEDMHRRIARELHRIELKYKNPMSEDEIFEMLDRFKYFVPAGSPMAGIGNNTQITSLSNCYVAGNEEDSDSYGGILKVDELIAQIQKRRGGVGTDMSYIRPKGTVVKNAANTSTGMVSYMERFSNTTREVAQGGRRGALMLTCDCRHPDIFDFVGAKKDLTKITGANISVKVSDEFMKAVENDGEFTLQYPVDSPNPTVKKVIKARDLWKEIIHNNWANAEPGTFFWDRTLQESPTDCYTDIGWGSYSSNPCGEQILPKYFSCLLSSINLYSFVDNPFTENSSFNWAKFDDVVNKGVRLLNNIQEIEVERVDRILEKIKNDPESDFVKATEVNLWENVKDRVLRGRRIGLGITAEADMLAALGITYGTPEATQFVTNLHEKLAFNSYVASINLAEERGCFPEYSAEKEKGNAFIDRILPPGTPERAKMEKFGRRNIMINTIAPNGSVSIMTQTSSGIEPVFMLSYLRRRKVDKNDKSAKIDFIDATGDAFEMFDVYHHKFKDWMIINGYDVDKKYSTDELNAIIEKSPYYNATANDIDPYEKARMQGSVQKYIDSSISVTTNLPATITEEEVSDLYLEAWRAGCKGFTIYREGSRDGVLVAKKEEKPEKHPDDDVDVKVSHLNRKRPEVLKADVVRFKNNKENWVAFIGLGDNNMPYEIFTGPANSDDDICLPNSVESGEIIKVKTEDGKRYDFKYVNKKGIKTTIEGIDIVFQLDYWNVAKMISAFLRMEIPLPQVIKLIQGLEFPMETINSWRNGVVRALKKFVKNGEKADGAVCSECGSTSIVFSEGCLLCKNCGSSKCG